MKSVVVIPHPVDLDFWHKPNPDYNCLFVWECYMKPPTKRLCDLQTILKNLKHLSQFSGLKDCQVVFSKDFMNLINHDLDVAPVIEQIKELFGETPLVFEEWNNYVV